jgi:hypothetical protein
VGWLLTQHKCTTLEWLSGVMVFRWRLFLVIMTALPALLCGATGQADTCSPAKLPLALKILAALLMQ